MKVETEGSGATTLSTPESPVLIGKFPTDTPTNFKYNAASGVLVFSDLVFPDGDLHTVKKQDEAWENRGDTAFVYDETFERHWDTWVGPKRSSLFSVKLAKGASDSWSLGAKFVNLLNGTGHVRRLQSSYPRDAECLLSTPRSSLSAAQTISMYRALTSSTRRRTPSCRPHGTRSRT